MQKSDILTSANEGKEIPSTVTVSAHSSEAHPEVNSVRDAVDAVIRKKETKKEKSLEKGTSSPKQAQEDFRSIDWDHRLKMLLKELPHAERTLLEAYEFKWENSGKQWKSGLADYIRSKIIPAGSFRDTILKDLIKPLKDEYLAIRGGSNKNQINLLKGQVTILEKIAGIFSPNGQKEESNVDNNQMESFIKLWGWKNIKETGAGLIFSLTGASEETRAKVHNVIGLDVEPANDVKPGFDNPGQTANQSDVPPKSEAA